MAQAVVSPYADAFLNNTVAKAVTSSFLDDTVTGFSEDDVSSL